MFWSKVLTPSLSWTVRLARHANSIVINRMHHNNVTFSANIRNVTLSKTYMLPDQGLPMLLFLVHKCVKKMVTQVWLNDRNRLSFFLSVVVKWTRFLLPTRDMAEYQIHTKAKFITLGVVNVWQMRSIFVPTPKQPLTHVPVSCFIPLIIMHWFYVAP